MFRKFFAALSNLTLAVETLTASVLEANNNFRSNLGLDHEPEQPALAHKPGSNGQTRRHKATK